MTTLYVYLAGPLSGDPGEYLAGVSVLSRHSRWLMQREVVGVRAVPVNPAADLLEGLASGEPLPVARYRERSLALLELVARAEWRCLWVVASRRRDGSESEGVRREVRAARRLGVPVAWSRREVLRLLADAGRAAAGGRPAGDRREETRAEPDGAPPRPVGPAEFHAAVERRLAETRGDRGTDAG